jgi:uncharacterized protein DUF5753
VPGLLQTAEYARHVFTALASLADSATETDAAVHARMEAVEGEQARALLARIAADVRSAGD